MLSIDEFKLSISGYYKRNWTIFGAFSVIAVACFGALSVAHHAIQSLYATWFGPTTAEHLSVFTPGLSVIIIVLVGVWAAERWSRPDARLRCPSCGKFLVDARRLVIATRNCCYCGKRVLAEPSATD